MAKYPFKTLAVGESSWVAAKPTNASRAAWKQRKKICRRFTCRAETHRGVKGTRVWRIE